MVGKPTGLVPEWRASFLAIFVGLYTRTQPKPPAIIGPKHLWVQFWSAQKMARLTPHVKGSSFWRSFWSTHMGMQLGDNSPDCKKLPWPTPGWWWLMPVLPKFLKRDGFSAPVDAPNLYKWWCLHHSKEQLLEAVVTAKASSSEAEQIRIHCTFWVVLTIKHLGWLIA